MAYDMEASVHEALKLWGRGGAPDLDRLSHTHQLVYVRDHQHDLGGYLVYPFAWAWTMQRVAPKKPKSWLSWSRLPVPSKKPRA